ncbi:M-phase phosphoprotein 6 [Eucyclogobius newberryi]|uniref:M-phase phosphoprotein 6 n=1 Tax=Eucyclogobius newberryi TaxID=166745 RepID=UPI003B593436
MANDNAKLSKNVLRMKFMQRGLDAETKKQLEEDERRIISDEHWYLDLPELHAKENLVMEEKSIVPCEDLRYGRVSFMGFNPEVEKLMLLMNPKEETEEDEKDDLRKMQTDVTDEEMALRYESLVSSMKKKYAKKRERAAKDQDVNQNVHEAERERVKESVHEASRLKQNVSESKRAFMKPQD